MWCPSTGELKNDLVGHAHWVNSISLNSDYVVRTGAFEAGRRDIFESEEDMEKQALKRYGEFSKGQQERLVSGSDDFTLILWVDFKIVKRMTGHS